MDESEEPTDLQSTIASLIQQYEEVTPPFVEVREGAPTALEFLRQVAANLPIVYKGAASGWPALDPAGDRRWSKAYLQQVVGETMVEVAETPYGNADAPVGELFVQPHSVSMKFTEFIQAMTDRKNEKIVHYMQSQNNNMSTEFTVLAPDVGEDLPFATEALGMPPEAVNVWIGDGRSRTSLHRDPFENLHVQVLGQKQFELIAPIAHASVEEQQLRPARYRRNYSGVFVVEKEPVESPNIPWPTRDTSLRDGDARGVRMPGRVLRVVLEPGDMLYLPALWYHAVAQTPDSDGVVCSVNYWYDVDVRGPAWTLAETARKCTRVLQTMAEQWGAARAVEVQAPCVEVPLTVTPLPP
ncbi:cupin-like domain-containing protein [Limtongia smithiae]|uniref:cupin-like domain-containing protein n=1 Tax=Limtongia smithiae TaxID=1125753 RepID=UPI0034CDEB40